MSIRFAIPNFPGKQKLVAATSKVAVRVSKHSPEILVGVGVLGFVGTAVLAATSTLKLDDILTQHEEKIEQIKECAADETLVEYSEEDAIKDKSLQTIKTCLKVGKLYAPALMLGMFSAACVIGGHHILLKRNIALTAAYTGVQKAYDAYRKRVQDEVGEERERELYLGVDKVMEEVEKNGKKKQIETKAIKGSPYGLSPYARCFDEASRWWKKNPEMNKMFLTAQQNYMNDLLRLQGHLFLNEVYDALDMPRTSMGAVVGWVYGNGDGYVDFGIFDPQDPASRDFINCRERNIWLDFNVDGVIYDLI